MPVGLIKKRTIFLMLGLFAASAFFVRLENFKNSEMRTIDEIVYYHMAEQVLDQGLSGYNSVPYGEELASKGRPLPDYFFQPLFKHPPVFTFLAALSIKVFGKGMIFAEYVSLLMSVLMIPLIYLLGTLVYDRRVGILSAFFLWIDPGNIICSQKIWMDTTIAFFTLLAAVLFIGGLKHNRD
jgi:dolichyl-phosphate-mannose--protein O-mannosyl transferase